MCWTVASILCGSARAAEAPSTTAPSVASPAPATIPAATPVKGPLPVDAFYDKAAVYGAKLSPNGQFVAAVIRRSDGTAVLVHDLQVDKSAIALSTDNKDATFDWVRWKGDGRLVVGVTYLHIDRWGGKSDGEIRSWKYSKFLMSMDRDGSHQTTLFRDDKHTWSHTEHNYVIELMDALDKDPDHILAFAPTLSGQYAVWRADVHTGAAEMIERGGENVLGWNTDTNGAIVARFRASGSTLIIEGRAPGETKWAEVTRIRTKDFDRELSDFEFMGATDQPGALYVAVKPKDPSEGAARTIHIYDFRTHTLGPPVWKGVDYDITRIVRSSGSNDMAGVCYWVDTYTCAFKDPHAAAVMRGISTYFHNAKNVSPVSFSDDGHWWLLDVTGPDDPGGYYLYDNVKHEVLALGVEQPALSDRLGPMDRFVFTARDGTQVHGYVTTPPGASKGPLPLIVLPHGGPEGRDYFDYDLITQFLATRGYAVLQINFRGSSGYGVKWAEAGYRQWGGRMQDDVDDGVKALIASGRIDPKRVCAVGISYGGYAALMAGARHPELYKCVVSWAGDADLVKSVKWEHGQSGDDQTRYAYWVKSMGDPDKDRDMLVRNSPVTYAASYGPPVLLLHGEDDENVDPNQSKIMEKALKKAGRDVRLIMVKDEAHPAWSDDHMKTALTEIAVFLNTHIAPATTDAPAATSAQATGVAAAAPAAATATVTTP